jgi:hypothetical protein
MRATRKTLVEAKSQHLPEERWFVIGAPSKGMRTLKVWVSAIVMGWDVRIAVGGFTASAEIARRF